jgi:EmrB/QacA subfamily drug resistance transporter
VTRADVAASTEPSIREHGTAEQRRYAWLVLSVTSLGMVLFGLNASMLNVALPRVVEHFHADAFAANWLLLSFMLVNTVMIVVFGRLADIFGRREMYLLGFAVFTVASFLAGLAPDVWVLIGLRAVQATGAAMILANSSALITAAFPPGLLAQGMGIYMATISIASLVGPSLGGAIVAAAGWQWVFWFNVPVGVVATAWGVVTLRRVPKGPREKVDLPGNLLVFLLLGGLLLALSEGGTLGWTAPAVLVGGLAFVLLLPPFVWWERRTDSPVVDLSLFEDRYFTLATAAAFFQTLARFSVVLIFALLFQSLYGDDPFTAGLKVMPVPLGMLIASPLTGYLGRDYDQRRVSMWGSVVTTGGLLVLLLSLRADPSYAVVAVGLLLSGLGTGIFLTANTTAIMARAPENRLGIVNGVRLMVQNCGIVIGTALVLALITSPLDASARGNVYAGDLAHLSARHTTQLVTGYRWALSAMVVAAIIGALATRGDSDRGLRRLVRRRAAAVTRHTAEAVTVTHVEGG